MQSHTPTTSSEGTDNRQKPKRPRLTASQLERKRELDRDAQRSIRAKTKSRIAHLESLVSILQAPDAANSRTSELIAQVNNQKQEIDKLRDALSGISKIVGSVGDSATIPQIPATLENTSASDFLENDLEEPYPFVFEDTNVELSVPQLSRVTDSGNDIQPSSRDEASILRPRYGRHISNTASINFNNGTSSSPEELSLEGSRQLADGENRGRIQIRRRGNQHMTGNGGSRVSQIASDILQNHSMDGRLWYLAGSILSSILDVPDQQLTPSKYAEDIAIRAVLHGWSAAASRYELDAGWQWLRQLDEALYSSLGIPERLSILRIMRLQYLVAGLRNS